jgi:hypothetical protein
MTRVCVHLVESTNGDYAKSFSGSGTEYALVCLGCRKAPEMIESNLREVSPERFSQIEENGCWDWDRDAILGRPEVLERAADLSFRHETIALVGKVAGTVVDLKPIPLSLRGECVVLLEDGDLLRVDPILGSASRLMNAFDTGIALEPNWSLHVSPRGDMAAVVEARGRHGVVLDLETGRPTMKLDRKDYYPEQTEFPVAFFESDGQLRLVHGTDWNRLDVSDPRTGGTLTHRSPTSYESDEERPEHDLNYFHGGLAVSPGGEFVADNGWVWSPVGVVTSWDLRRWVGANPWESEDGPSRRELCARSSSGMDPSAGSTTAHWLSGATALMTRTSSPLR